MPPARRTLSLACACPGSRKFRLRFHNNPQSAQDTARASIGEEPLLLFKLTPEQLRIALAGQQNGEPQRRIAAAFNVSASMISEAQRARAVDQRKRALAEWLDAQTARDSNGDETAWHVKPCPTLMFVNGAGELDQKHDQDLRDTCVMLLDRAGCDLLTICDITGHSYRSAQTIVKHYRARNAALADSGIDRLELQVRTEGMKS